LGSTVYAEGTFFIQEYDILLMITHTTTCLEKEGQGIKSLEKLGKRMLMRRIVFGVWTGSEGDEDDEKENDTKLEREIKKVKRQAKENANLIDADDSDELRSICPESDEDNMTLWSGSEDDDIPTEAHPNERSDSYIDKAFEFDE
jgi:hypothetical protein